MSTEWVREFPSARAEAVAPVHEGEEAARLAVFGRCSVVLADCRALVGSELEAELVQQLDATTVVLTPEAIAAMDGFADVVKEPGDYDAVGGDVTRECAHMRVYFIGVLGKAAGVEVVLIASGYEVVRRLEVGDDGVHSGTVYGAE